MKEYKNYKTLEENIRALRRAATRASYSFGEILHIFSGKGRFLILILLSLPFCQPIQIPGLSTPFGLVIAFIGLRTAFGKQIWLPKRILAKRIKRRTLEKLTATLLRWLKKIKYWIHPRLEWMCYSSSSQVVNGLIICALGLFLALPLPIPLSNLTVAWSICLISLGILEDDGLFVLIGYFTTLLTIGIFTFLALSIERAV